MFLWHLLCNTIPAENHPSQTTEECFEIHNRSHFELFSRNDSVNSGAVSDHGRAENQALHRELNDSQDSLALRNNLVEGILVWIPTSSKVKTLFPKNYKGRSKVKVDTILHQASNFSEETIRKVYSVHLNKYISAQGVLKGKVLDPINRKIRTSVIPMDKTISGSDDFYDNCIVKMKDRIAQNGQLFLSVTTTFPKNNYETIASYLVQMDYVVTQDMKSNENSHFNKMFLVHNHKADTDCNENCASISLENFLETRFDINAASVDIVPTYVANCFNKMKEFIQNIVKCPNFLLEAEEFSFIPTYRKNGEVRLKGIVWPKLFSKFNKMIADTSYGYPWKEEVEQEILEKLETIILTRTDTQSYEEDLCVPHLIADSNSTLSESFQLHYESCSICSFPELPSMESLITKPFITSANIFPSARLSKIMLDFLTSLSKVDKERLSILEFLDRIYQSVVEDVTVNEEEIKFKISNEELYYVRDETLSMLIVKYGDQVLMALYQYSIMFSDSYKVVLKKKMIKEVFTHPYSMFYLKAAKATIEVEPTIGSNHWLSNYYKGSEFEEGSYSYHRAMSLSEAIATLDGRKFNVPNSQTTVFVNLLQSDYINIKKVEKESDISFEENQNNFEELASLKKSFFLRINAFFLTLCEFVIWYENEKNATDIFSGYKDRVESITESEILNFDGTEKLPLYILLANGAVLKMRSSPKVLCLPSTCEMSRKEKWYCQVLLYSKYLRSDVISENEVENLYFQEDPVAENQNCNNLLNNRRRKIFPYGLNEAN